MGQLSSLKIREQLLKSEGFKEFSKTDWYGYAGAEKFEDGSDPIIKETGEIVIIFDANGFEVDSSTDDEEIATFSLDK